MSFLVKNTGWLGMASHRTIGAGGNAVCGESEVKQAICKNEKRKPQVAWA
jgi:hypothetical protein